MKFFALLAVVAATGLAAPIHRVDTLFSGPFEVSSRVVRTHDDHPNLELAHRSLHNRMLELGEAIASIADQQTAAKLMSSASDGAVTYADALQALRGKSSDVVAAVKSASSKKLALVMKFNDEAKTMTVAEKLDTLSSASFKSQTTPEIEVSLKKALKATQSPNGSPTGDGSFSKVYDAAAADVKAIGQKAAAAATDFQQLQAIKDFKAKQAAKAAKVALKGGAATN